jgi:hypothetical protein
MYNSDTFFNIDVLKEVLNEYKWPLEYKLKEHSDEVIIEFPQCSLIIKEGFESKMYAYFLNSQTGRSDTQHSLNVFDAVEVLKSINPQIDQELKLKGLLHDLEDEPSLEVVKQGLHNICILLQAYLLPCIKGDFSWVEEYNNWREEFNKKHPG